MSDDRSRYRPWEKHETELTQDQVKEQAARLLACGAVQAARKRRGQCPDAPPEEGDGP